MKAKIKTRDEKGITLVGLIILIAIVVFIVIIMRWAVGLSEVVNQKTKRHQEFDIFQETTSESVKY